jgi:hypothetical protein
MEGVLRSLLFLSVAVLLSACGGTPEPPEENQAAEVSGPRGGLVFSRADGSEIDIPGRAVVWCGPWNDMIPAQALQIAAIEGVEPAPGQEWFSYWRVWAIVADVRTGKPVTFPNEFVWNKPRRAEIFVGDFPTENEASSKQEGSSGHIVFRKATCELGGEVEFTIDAAIGSEFGDNEPILAAGTFRGVVGEPPARYY